MARSTEPPHADARSGVPAALTELASGESLEATMPAAAASPPPLHRLIEALLFLGGPPVSLERAVEAIRGLTAEQLLDAIETLNRDYRNQGRPYRIRPRGSGHELALLPRFRIVQDRLQGAVRETRLSPAALDVLALVAYRQPLSRAEVESLRGGDSAAVLRQLVRLGLITVQRGAGAQDALYHTTRRFLDLFGLRNLDDLPRTEELRRL